MDPQKISKLLDFVEHAEGEQKQLRKEFDAEKKRREVLEARFSETNKSLDRYDHALVHGGIGLDDPSLAPIVRMDPTYHSPVNGRNLPNATCAKALAHFMRFVTTGNKKSLEFLEKNGIEPRKVDELEERGGSIHDDEVGGYAIPPEFGGVFLQALPRYGVAARHCQLEPMTSAEKIFAKDGTDVNVYPLEELGDIPEVDASYKQVTLHARLFGAFARWSESLQEDSIINQGETWAERFARAIAKKMDQVLFLGDGSSTYSGMIGLLNHANVQLVSLPATKTAFNDLTYGDVINLMSVVPDEVYEEGNSQFFLSNNLVWLLAGLVDGVGRPLWADAREGVSTTVLGEPIVRSSVLPRISATAAGKKFMLFGDMKRAVRLGIRTQMSILFSPHAFFKSGGNALRVMTRFGIAITDANAMAALKTADL